MEGWRGGTSIYTSEGNDAHSLNLSVRNSSTMRAPWSPPPSMLGCWWAHSCTDPLQSYAIIGSLWLHVQKIASCSPFPYLMAHIFFLPVFSNVSWGLEEMKTKPLEAISKWFSDHETFNSVIKDYWPGLLFIIHGKHIVKPIPKMAIKNLKWALRDDLVGKELILQAWGPQSGP